MDSKEPQPEGSSLVEEKSILLSRVKEDDLTQEVLDLKMQQVNKLVNRKAELLEREQLKGGDEADKEQAEPEDPLISQMANFVIEPQSALGRMVQ